MTDSSDANFECQLFFVISKYHLQLLYNDYFNVARKQFIIYYSSKLWRKRGTTDPLKSLTVYSIMASKDILKVDFGHTTFINQQYQMIVWPCEVAN